jgi:hypothetical protein
LRCIGSGKDPEGEEEERSLGPEAARDQLIETEQVVLTIAITTANFANNNVSVIIKLSRGCIILGHGVSRDDLGDDLHRQHAGGQQPLPRGQVKLQLLQPWPLKKQGQGAVASSLVLLSRWFPSVRLTLKHLKILMLLHYYLDVTEAALIAELFLSKMDVVHHGERGRVHQGRGGGQPPVQPPAAAGRGARRPAPRGPAFPPVPVLELAPLRSPAILGDLDIPGGMDPSFLAVLPENMRAEVIEEHPFSRIIVDYNRNFFKAVLEFAIVNTPDLLYVIMRHTSTNQWLATTLQACGLTGPGLEILSTLGLTVGSRFYAEYCQFCSVAQCSAVQCSTLPVQFMYDVYNESPGQSRRTSRSSPSSTSRTSSPWPPSTRPSLPLTTSTRWPKCWMMPILPFKSDFLLESLCREDLKTGGNTSVIYFKDEEKAVIKKELRELSPLLLFNILHKPFPPRHLQTSSP